MQSRLDLNDAFKQLVHDLGIICLEGGVDLFEGGLGRLVDFGLRCRRVARVLTGREDG